MIANCIDLIIEIFVTFRVIWKQIFNSEFSRHPLRSTLAFNLYRHAKTSEQPSSGSGNFQKNISECLMVACLLNFTTVDLPTVKSFARFSYL